MNAIKFTLILLLSTLFVHTSFALPTTAKVSPENVFDGMYTVDQVMNMNAKTYKSLTGEKMTFKDRVALNLVKADLKIRESRGEDLGNGIAMGQAMDNFSIGGFLLGLFLGLLGVLIALFFKDKRVRKSAWKGVLVWLVLLIVFGINIRS